MPDYVCINKYCLFTGLFLSLCATGAADATFGAYIIDRASSTSHIRKLLTFNLYILARSTEYEEHSSMLYYRAHAHIYIYTYIIYICIIHSVCVT